MSDLNNRATVTMGTRHEESVQQQQNAESSRTEKWNSGGKQNQQQTAQKGNQRKLVPSSISISPLFSKLSVIVTKSIGTLLAITLHIASKIIL